MQLNELKNIINSNDFNKIVSDIYCSDKKEVIEDERSRYLNLIDKTMELYGDGDYKIISSPGRIEIGGNHTDHQKGFVIAASINIDNVCIVKKTNDMKVSFYDDRFSMNEIELYDLSIHEEEKGNTKSILRGTAKRFVDLNYKIGGFAACQDSRVLIGSGLSSSACFEILVTEIYNILYNDNKVSNVDRAIISKWVENNFFGKPCGLMDQMSISVGGFSAMDFYDEIPKIERTEFSFSQYGYNLVIVNSKANHADLTSEYAAIPDEMHFVATYFSKDYLSRVKPSDFYSNIKNIRDTLKNDRAVLRAFHYFNEVERAHRLNDALKDKNIDKILKAMNTSGNSSYKYLQNVYDSHNTKQEAVAIALAISEKYIGEKGVARVQGGGFAGTIQVIVDNEHKEEFLSKISEVFGEDSIMLVEIRNDGTKLVI